MSSVNSQSEGMQPMSHIPGLTPEMFKAIMAMAQAHTLQVNPSATSTAPTLSTAPAASTARRGGGDNSNYGKRALSLSLLKGQ